MKKSCFMPKVEGVKNVLSHRLGEKAPKHVDTENQFCQHAAMVVKAPLRWLSMLMLALVVSGCASLKLPTAENRLAERAEQRWHALIAGDFDQAYEYETPGYRAVYSKKAFQNRFGRHVRWVNASTHSVKIHGDIAEVRVMIGYRSLTTDGQPIDGVQPIQERWQLVDGKWWYSKSL